MPSQAPSSVRSRCIFRVAAGPRVGYGHLMRARALASCLDMEIAVSVRGGKAARETAQSLGPILAGPTLARHDLLIVDDPSLARGRAWIARARRHGIPSVSIHDSAAAHAADLIVCASLGIPRPRIAAPALTGPRFYLLDRRIAAAREQRPAGPLRARPRVLVALGGGAHVRRLARVVVDALVARCPNVDVVVASGFARGPRPRLQHGSWLDARSGLVTALSGADLAIVAGGVTLYEACALGVPAVALAVVPAQRRAIRAFAREHAVIDAGASITPRALERAADAVAMLMADGRLRRAIAARARGLVDGRGAERVAARIHQLLEARAV